MARRNSVIGTLIETVAEKTENYSRRNERRHTIVDGTLFNDESFVNLKESVASYVTEATSSVASLLSNGAAAMKNKISDVLEESETVQSITGIVNKIAFDRSTRQNRKTPQSKYLNSKINGSPRSRSLSVTSDSQSLVQDKQRRFWSAHHSDDRFKHWLDSLQTHCNKMTTMKKSQSVNLQRPCAEPNREYTLKKACSDDKNMCKHRESEHRNSKGFLIMTTTNEDEDDHDALAWSALRYKRRSTGQSDVDVGIQNVDNSRSVRQMSCPNSKCSQHQIEFNAEQEYKRSTSWPNQTNKENMVNSSRRLTFADISRRSRCDTNTEDDNALNQRKKTVKKHRSTSCTNHKLFEDGNKEMLPPKPSFIHTSEGWKHVGPVNIVPEEEFKFNKTPHFKRKLNTSAVKLSKTEIDYAVQKTETKQEQLEGDSNRTVFGNLNISIQFLIITKRLKVTIHSLENIENWSSKDNENTNVSYFVKMCIVPRTVRKQKRVKPAKGSSTVKFDEDIYLKGITFENVHLLTLRFRLFRGVTKYHILKRYSCVAETTVCLDDLDVIGRVKLCKALHKTNA